MPGNGPMFGGESAPVTIVEFSDFQCPFCSRAAETVDELKKKYGSKIKLYFQPVPAPDAQDARPAAEAALCVNEQGTAKFWKFHDLRLQEPGEARPRPTSRNGRRTPAPTGQVQGLRGSKQFDARVQSDMDYGEKIGVKSTPTFFVNGQLLSGALPLDQFSEVIDDMAEKK